MVEQAGGIACHTGRERCFHKRLAPDGWHVVEPVLEDFWRIVGADGRIEPRDAMPDDYRKSLIRQIASGAYLPEIEITKEMLRALFNGHAPEFVDKMEASSGIRSRWYAPEHWAASDLAEKAARVALERAHKTADEIDLIILGMGLKK